MLERGQTGAESHGMQFDTRLLKVSIVNDCPPSLVPPKPGKQRQQGGKACGS
jgi:hypothetical protein